MKRLYSLALAAAVSASFVMIAIAPADADHGTQVTGASSFTSRHLPLHPRRAVTGHMIPITRIAAVPTGASVAAPGVVVISC
jgi:hypothetical protein